MTVSDAGQAKVFLINVLFGMAFVLIFDFFRALRRRHRGSALYANLLDAVYFIAAFFPVLFLSLKFNFGAVRYYQLMGLFMGAFLHILIFSRFEVKIFERVIALSAAAAKTALRTALFPPVLIIRLTAAPLLAIERKIIEFFDKISDKRKVMRKKRRQNKKILKKRIKMM